ncbi:MAG: 3-isopropylmalate dehydrogenase, partial [Nitrospirae bacterium]|nr:3-isopropylmalate dehydrogenase [Nitrospirota bacterium]
NPLAAILSAGMMLKYSFGMGSAAERLDRALAALLDAGWRTRDIAQGDPGEKIVGTAEMGDRIVEAYSRGR